MELGKQARSQLALEQQLKEDALAAHALGEKRREMLENSLDAARVRQEELIASEAQQRIVASSRFAVGKK